MIASVTCYQAYGMVLQSEIELPGLRVCARPPDLHIRYGRVPDLRPGGQPYCVFGRGEVVFSNPVARFAIRDAREVTVEPQKDAAPASIRSLLKGKVISLVLRQRGWLPLHASAVEIGDKAVLFMGTSGAGKSTLAAALSVGANRFLADDVSGVRMEGGAGVVLPGFGRVRLDDDAAGAAGLSALPHLPDDGKKSFEVTNSLSDGTSVAIGAIVSLEYGDGTELTKTDLLTGVTLVDRHIMMRRLVSCAPVQIIEAQLKQSSEIGGCVPVYRLRRPKELDLLSQVRRLIECSFRK